MLNPSEIALIDLAADQNYTATDATCPAPVNAQGNPTAVCFSAGTSTSNSINWTTTLTYATSGGLGPISTPHDFSTTSGGAQNEQYVSEGGQVQATATTTASDGSTVQDCVTSYIEGPAGGIPDATITGQLDGLYTASKSYPTDPSGQYPPYSNLMTGVAKVESMYAQFETPAACTDPSGNGHPDLWSLDKTYGILAKWPEEPYVHDSNGNCIGTNGGSHIGLMQVATASDQTTDPNAWKWADPTPAASANANDAVNLFSGTVSPNKITLASTYATDIIDGDPKVQPPIDGYYDLAPPVGHQLENMALVLYGGWLVKTCGNNPSETCRNDSEYYFPSCSGTEGTTKYKGNTDLTCSTGWTWAPNSNQPGGVNYVSNIMSNLQ